jgi:flagellar P-ring protein precursor FlgI
MTGRHGENAKMRRARQRARVGWIVGWTLAAALPATAEVRVQDIARLQGQRTNKLMGYGLVVGLAGTGDGEKYAPTMRALMKLHQRYHAPILTEADIKGNRSVAIVAVEATIPEHGAREGQAIDVVVSAVGTAKSLRGGQLLTTPLQYAMFDPEDPATQGILALAGGQVVTPDESTPTRGIIRQGATLEEDFLYHFVQDGCITLVLDDAHAGWPWAHMVARALNHELSAPPVAASGGPAVVSADTALALGPKNVLVRIPEYELEQPAGFISRVLQTPLFVLPEQPARVTINRTNRSVSFTGTVTVSPTVLQLPGLGTVVIGRSAAPGAPPGEPAAATPATATVPNTAVPAGGAVEFSELLNALSAVKATPEQLINAIEHLHKTGSLHAQLQYE